MLILVAKICHHVMHANPMPQSYETNYFYEAKHKNKLQHNDIHDVIICTVTSLLRQFIRGIILHYCFVTLLRFEVI